MVVREDGTKWACQSCLKGHRVSGCTHTDRELTLVPKKGRPVTQCQHCRLERKKRSAHVKCDCGEADKPHHSKEKCIHLREAEERAKAGHQDDHHHHPREDDPNHLAAVAEEQGCCCGHGGKCTCSLIKKEPQSIDDIAPHGPAVPKPRLESIKSDGHITVFANGHHKPVHKRNHAAHECGMPYKMPTSRSSVDQQPVTTAARRSVDNLALDSNMSWHPASVASPTGPPLMNTGRRMSKSEQPSPRLTAMSNGLSEVDLSSIDFSNLGPVQTNLSLESAMGDTSMFPSLDPMSALTDAGYDPWSTFPSADSNLPNNNPFSAWATTLEQSNGAQPALTAASSGTQSEIDELPTMDDLYGFQMPSIQEDGAAFGQDMPATDSNNPYRRSLPPGFFGNAEFSLTTIPNEWQTSIGRMHDSGSSKPRAVSNDQAVGMMDSCKTPTMPAMTNMTHTQRSNPMTPNLRRPQSHSIGPGSAPNDDLIKQLFPDIDINNGGFGVSNSPPAMELANMKRISGQTLNLSPSAMDIGPMDESMSLTSQPWTDGSMSVPADTFTSSYNLDSDFANADFNNSWSYQ